MAQLFWSRSGTRTRMPLSRVISRRPTSTSTMRAVTAEYPGSGVRAAGVEEYWARAPGDHAIPAIAHAPRIVSVLFMATSLAARLAALGAWFNPCATCVSRFRREGRPGRRARHVLRPASSRPSGNVDGRSFDRMNDGHAGTGPTACRRVSWQRACTDHGRDPTGSGPRAE